MSDTLVLRRGTAGAALRPDLPPAPHAAGRSAGRRPAPIDDRPTSRARRMLSGLVTLALIGLVALFWPAALGGSTRLVIVSGHSMEPTYDLGDIVVARDGGRPDVGDAVVFAVPEGAAEGILVIHRITAVDDDGFFVTQGDNRDTPDVWKLTDDDIVGHPWLRVPKGGLAVWFLRQRIVMAVLLGMLTMLLLWPKRHHPVESDDSEDAHDAQPADVADLADVADRAGVPATNTSRTDHPSDADVMAEANAWLDAQLAAVIGDVPAARPLERRMPRRDPDAVVVAAPETTVQRIRSQVLRTTR